ncbi:MAG: hypothetical protein ACK53Y_02375, partial [bacterium]
HIMCMKGGIRTFEASYQVINMVELPVCIFGARKGFVLQRKATAFLIRHERYDVMQAEVVLNDHAQTRQLTPAVRGIVRRYTKVELGKVCHGTMKKENTMHSCCRVIIFIVVHICPRPLQIKARIGS